MKRDPWLAEFYILLLLFVVKLLCQRLMNSWRSLFLTFLWFFYSVCLWQVVTKGTQEIIWLFQLFLYPPSHLGVLVKPPGVPSSFIKDVQTDSLSFLFTVLCKTGVNLYYYIDCHVYFLSVLEELLLGIPWHTWRLGVLVLLVVYITFKYLVPCFLMYIEENVRIHGKR